MAKTTAKTKQYTKTEQGERQRQSTQPPGDVRDQTTKSIQPRARRVRDVRQQGGLKSLTEEQLARGLGWFGIGLGLAEVLAPRGLAKLIGVRKDHTLLLRLFGLREIASGVTILAQRRPTEGVWSRVAGDALDLASLGAAFASPKADKGRLAFATASVLGVTALDVICAQQLSLNDSETTKGGTIHVQKSVIINRSPEELYRFWHDFQNLPQFMYHLQSVQVTGEGRSHWVVNGPAGTTVEWDAEIVEDRPNELISWRSLEGADVDNSGTVRFEPAAGNRGTVVSADVSYSPPGGVIGSGIAWFFGEEPRQQIKDDLRRFKQVIETGEVVRSDACLEGMGVILQRPAQPPAGKSGQ